MKFKCEICEKEAETKNAIIVTYTTNGRTTFTKIVCSRKCLNKQLDKAEKIGKIGCFEE